MSIVQLKKARKDLAQCAREVIHNSTDLQTYEEIAECAIARCDLSDLTIEGLLQDLALKEAKSQAKALSATVPFDEEAGTQTTMEFPEAWFDCVQIHDGGAIKNRYANRFHNILRKKKIDENAAHVMEAQNREHQRIARLDLAYTSDETIKNNEQAIEWLAGKDM